MLPLVTLLESAFFVPPTFHSRCEAGPQNQECFNFTEASSGYRSGINMLVKIREVFDVLEYFTLKLLLYLLVVIGAVSLIAHAIKISF